MAATKEQVELIHAIAEALAAPVVAELDYWRPTFRLHLDEDEHAPNFQIVFQDNEKLHVYGCWPGGKQGSVTPNDVLSYAERTGGKATPEINVSANKGPNRIAAEIQLRFLPNYLPLYQLCLAVSRGRADYAQRKEALIAKVAEVLGESRASPNTLVGYSPYMVADNFSPEDGKFRLSITRVTVDQLETIIAALRPKQGGEA